MEARGRLLADSLVDQVRPEAAGFRVLAGRPATLAAATASDPAGLRFLQIKADAFGAAGLEVRACILTPGATTSEVLSQVHALNVDRNVDAIFLQLPLPVGVAAQRVADQIEPVKDVDAMGSASLGKVLTGGQLYLPATPAAVLLLLEDAMTTVRDRSVVVVGRDAVAERCIALLTITRGGTACVLPPDDLRLPDAAAGADAIVITDALPPADALSHARNGAILIDAAYHRPPRPANWLPARARKQLGMILPQYRNVGPLTMALLMQATLRAALSLRS